MARNRDMAVKSKDKLKEEFDEVREQTWSAFQEWEKKREELIDVFNRIADGLDKLETNVNDVQLAGARTLVIGAAVTTVGLLAAPIVVGGGLALSAVAGGLALGSCIGKEVAEYISLEKVDRMLEVEAQSQNDLEKCLNGLSQSCEGLSLIKPNNRRVIAFTQAERQLYKDLNILTQSKHTFKIPIKVPQDSGKGRAAVETMACFAGHLGNISEEDITKLKDRAKPLLKYQLLPVVFGIIATGIATGYMHCIQNKIDQGNKSVVAEELRKRASEFEKQLQACRKFKLTFDKENKRKSCCCFPKLFK